jgi:hypothetical protein
MRCGNNHDWERSAKVRGIVKVSIGPYSEIIKEIKRKSQQSTVSAFFLQKKERSSTIFFIEKSNFCITSLSK